MIDVAGIDEGASDWREMARLIREEGPIVRASVTELDVRLTGARPWTTC